MKQTVTRQSELESGYKYGFVTDIESEQIPKGIDKKTVQLISSIKKEPLSVTPPPIEVDSRPSSVSIIVDDVPSKTS